MPPSLAAFLTIDLGGIKDYFQNNEFTFPSSIGI